MSSHPTIPHTRFIAFHYILLALSTILFSSVTFHRLRHCSIPSSRLRLSDPLPVTRAKPFLFYSFRHRVSLCCAPKNPGNISRGVCIQPRNFSTVAHSPSNTRLHQHGPGKAAVHVANSPTYVVDLTTRQCRVHARTFRIMESQQPFNCISPV